MFVLADLPGVHVYFDDVHCEAESLDELLDLLDRVFARFREFKVALAVSKLQIGTTVKLLGWIRTQDGFVADPDKVAAIKALRSPSNRKELMSALGMLRYLAPAVPRLGEVVAPLNQLTSKKVTFVWKDAHERAWREALDLISRAETISIPDFSLPFVLAVDASEQGRGGVLFQPMGDGDGRRMLGYFSLAFKEPERRWSTFDKEASAVYEGVQYFAHLLQDVPFTLQTDHRPLIWVAQKAAQHEASARVVRWFMALSQFRFVVEHVPGRLNVVADALSRSPLPERQSGAVPEVVSVITRSRSAGGGKPGLVVEQMEALDAAEGRRKPTSRVKVAPKEKEEEERAQPQEAAMTEVRREERQEDHFERIALILLEGGDESILEDPALEDEVDLVRQHLDSLEVVGGRIKHQQGFYVHVSRREGVMFQAHEAPTSGHLGRNKTLERLRGKAWWPTITRDVKEFVRRCGICQRNKDRRSDSAPIQPLEVASCFERVHLDLVGPLPPTERGNRWVLTVVDSASKFVIAIPLKDKSASTVAEALVEQVYEKWGSPASIVTDGGGEFVNALNSALCARLGIAHRTTSPYHPASNGQVERMNGTLIQVVRCLLEPDQSNWDKVLGAACWAINTSVSSTTKMTPFFLMTGRDPITTLDVVLELPTPRILTREEWYRRLQKARRIAAGRDSEARQGDAGANQDPRFEVGDLVMVRFHGTKSGRSRKLSPKQQGPWRIVEIHDGVSATLEHFNNPRDRLRRHFNELVEYHGDPSEVHGDNEWSIDEIRGEAMVDGKHCYLVHFEQFPPETERWVEAKDIHAEELLRAWKERNKSKVFVYRVVDDRMRGRVREYQVVVEEDAGPDGYDWITEDRFRNPDILRDYRAGGGVVD